MSKNFIEDEDTVSKTGAWINNTKNVKFKKRILICVISGLFVTIIAIIAFSKTQNSDQGTVNTISKASLEKVIEKSDLATIDYTYNAVAAVYDEDESNLKYHVAYEGVVTAGIDITKINIDTNEGEKIITITIPKSQIQDINVNMGTLEFIFSDEQYETETVSQEAYKASLTDLKNKANKEESLLSLARDNAVAAIKALISPWVEQIDGEYTVEVK